MVILAVFSSTNYGFESYSIVLLRGSRARVGGMHRTKVNGQIQIAGRRGALSIRRA